MHCSPDLSILILTYQDGRDLLRTLRNFSDPKHGIKLEFVIIDVLSSLSRIEWREIREIQKSVSVRVFSSHKNHLAINRNLACQQALAESVLFLDADAELDPVGLDKMWSEWQRLSKTDEKIAGLGGINRPPDDGPFFQLQRDHQKMALGHLRSPQLWIPKKTTRVRFLSTVFVIFRKSRILDAGGFGNHYRTVCEDQELGFRLRKNKYHLYLSPAFQVTHRSESSWRAWMVRAFRFGEGQPMVMLDHPQALLGPKSLAYIFPMIWIFSFLHWQSWVFFGGTMIFYLGLLVCDILLSARRFEPVSFLTLMIFCGLSHFAYGLGLYSGIFKAVDQRLRKIPDLSDDVVTEMA